MKTAVRTQALLLLTLVSFGFNSANADVFTEGDIIVTDINNGSLIKVNPDTGMQTVISSGGLLDQPLV